MGLYPPRAVERAMKVQEVILQAVAVGTILSDRPPHRSQRAELPHWALTSGNNAQSLFGIRVYNSQCRKPSCR